MGKIHMSGASGGVMSDDVTASRADVLQGKRTITTESDDEVVAGTMPLKTTGQIANSCMIYNGYLYYRLPYGYYPNTYNAAECEARIDNASVRAAIGATNPAMWRVHANIAGLQGTIPDQGPWTVVPNTANQVAIYGGHYSTGNIIVSGDPNLVPGNIKKNAVIFGVRGTAEGWFPTPTDLYYNGVNSAGFEIYAFWVFQNTRIAYNYISTTFCGSLIFTKDIDVRSFNSLILEGQFRPRTGTDAIVALDKPKIETSWIGTRIVMNISQLSTIEAGTNLTFTNLMQSNASENPTNYITRIRLE